MNTMPTSPLCTEPRRVRALRRWRRRALARARAVAGALVASAPEAFASIALMAFAVWLATGAGRSLGADLVPDTGPAPAVVCEVAAADVFLDWFALAWTEAQ
jgi:hypothetical protein